MLSSLSIRDVVLIDKLNLSFDPGIVTLTGETGAGKSILLDALGLALGTRADAAVVRQGAERASVTAVFDIAVDHPARAQACYANALRVLRGDAPRPLGERSLRDQIAAEAVGEQRDELGYPRLQ